MTHASVFSGIGGPEVAAAMLGWENLFHCEINPFGRKVLEYWFPKSKSYEDITKTDFSEWRGRVNVLTGGFPCQPFSYAGQRRGAEDDRYLWPHMHRCINEVQPDWVVCENVAGILTMVEQGEVSPMESQASMFDEGDILRRYRLTETFTLERISRDIEADGYEVQSVLVPACAVGAPHRRDRVFIVGHRISIDTDNIRHAKERPFQRGQNTEPSRICEDDGRRPSTDPDSHRGSEVDEHMEPRQPNGAEPFGNGRERNATDTSSERPQAGHRGRETGETSRNASSGNARSDSEFGDIAGLGRWANFPSVSPVHRGNDGIPFPLDNLTISQGKWRTESLKAYGNAIVPQIMFELFLTILKVEQSMKEL